MSPPEPVSFSLVYSEHNNLRVGGDLGIIIRIIRVVGWGEGNPICLKSEERAAFKIWYNLAGVVQRLSIDILVASKFGQLKIECYKHPCAGFYVDINF